MAFPASELSIVDERIEAAGGDHAFARLQLIPTLRRAVSFPFYLHHWGARAAAVLQDPALEFDGAQRLLQQLPSIGRQDLAQRLQPRCDEGDEIVAVSYTSGTTGPFVFRLRTSHEARLIARLSERIYEPCAGTNPAARSPKPILVSFQSVSHGTPAFHRASGAIVLPGDMSDEGMIRRTIQLMQLRFALPGVAERASLLGGSLIHLRTLTHYLADRGIGADSFAIRAVGVYGGYLTRRVRQLLAEFWKCPIIDSFSVSECAGKGLVCPHCGHIEFDPQIYPTVLDLTADKPTAQRAGRLALTELLPFGWGQPLIKYITNDVVERIGAADGCPAHLGGIRRVGRVEQSVIVTLRGEPRVLLGSQDLGDALDREGVERRRADLNVDTLISTNDLGAPWARTDVVARGSKSIQVTIRYKPSSPPVAGCAEAIMQYLISRPKLRQLIAEQTLALSVLEDPSIGAPQEKFG